MKKVLSVIALILCCLLAFSSCDSSPYDFYVKRATKIEAECKEYSLKRVDDLNGDEAYYAITANDFVTRYYLLDPENDDGKADKEFYNYDGLYVYMSNRKLCVCVGKADFTLYDLTPQYFRDNSQAYNNIEKIWTEKYNVEQSDIPNLIVGAVVFDGNVFILAQNDQPQIEFDHEHTANLWKFNPTNGELAFCGFCVSRNGSKNNLSFFGDGDIAIVKI